MKQKGLSVYVYKSKVLGDCTNGLSTKHDKLFVLAPGETTVDGKELYPAIVIKERTWAGEVYKFAEPLEPVPAGRYGYMAGGNFIACSDSRLDEWFGQQVFPLHDRTE